MNSAEVAHVFRGSSNTRDITTLLYTWASYGYMKINIKKNKEFTLTVIFSILVYLNKNRYTKKGKRKLIIRSLIIGLLYIFIGFSLFKIYESEIDSYVIFINLIISYVGVFISSYIPIRSIYGKEVYAQTIYHMHKRLE